MKVIKDQLEDPFSITILLEDLPPITTKCVPLSKTAKKKEIAKGLASFGLNSGVGWEVFLGNTEPQASLQPKFRARIYTPSGSKCPTQKFTLQWS